MTYIIYVNTQGKSIADVLHKELENARLVPYSEYATVAATTGDTLVFIGALGICVRAIQPLIGDKHTDPAVVCVDSTGKYAIPVLSGHVGGANDTARRIARIIGCEPVVTTQSDNSGLWQLDTLARQYGWQEEVVDCTMNEAIAHFVNRQPTALVIEIGDKGATMMRQTSPDFIADDADMTVSVTPRLNGKRGIAYRPAVLHLGIGCAHDCPVGDIPQQIVDTVRSAGYSELSIATIDTIDIKATEPLFDALRQRMPWARLVTHSAETLNAIAVPHPSPFALKYVGTASVCEASAMTYGPLVIEKMKGNVDNPAPCGGSYTMALSIDADAVQHLTESDSNMQHQTNDVRIEIVGAGPGDPELISVRGKRLLEQADLILYAGSLVPERLTHYAKPGCVVRNSASMNLEEQFSLMQEFYDRGQRVVRLHTGDPCIYGAIQEQMALFDNAGMHYRITPGISAFQAAAAALNSQFTIPEKVQTIILTRGEGRTPMPEREQLCRLAQSRSTMCIYLSAAIAEDVQQQLLQAYPPETPVAACYKLTWPEEKIYRGQLKDLAKIVHDNRLTLTTLLVVGDAIDNRNGLSRLYADEFKHLFRK